MIQKNVVNLTKKTFHRDDFSLLNKNLNFIPNPGSHNKKIFEEDLEKYFRRIILKAHFKDSPKHEYEGYKNNSNSNWIPKNIHHSVKTYIQSVKNEHYHVVPLGVGHDMPLFNLYSTR